MDDAIGFTQTLIPQIDYDRASVLEMVIDGHSRDAYVPYMDRNHHNLTQNPYTLRQGFSFFVIHSVGLIHSDVELE